jgi:hypothetical protein
VLLPRLVGSAGPHGDGGQGRRGGVDVAVVPPNPGIRRALEIAGVDTMLAMHSALAEVL